MQKNVMEQYNDEQRIFLVLALKRIEHFDNNTAG